MLVVIHWQYCTKVILLQIMGLIIRVLQSAVRKSQNRQTALVCSLSLQLCEGAVKEDELLGLPVEKKKGNYIMH